MTSSPHLIDLPTIVRDDGDITVAENLPFDIKRVYWIHGTDEDSVRGSHAHKSLTQLIVPVAGSFLVRLDDGIKQRLWVLGDSTQGLLVPPMHWRTIDSFESGGIGWRSVCLVLCDQTFDESDYIRDYDQFLEAL